MVHKGQGAGASREKYWLHVGKTGVSAILPGGLPGVPWRTFSLFYHFSQLHSHIFFLFNLFSYINSFQNDGTVVYYKFSCNEICKTDFFIYLQKGVYTGTVVKECLGVGCGKHENYLHVQLFINNI